MKHRASARALLDSRESARSERRLMLRGLGFGFAFWLAATVSWLISFRSDTNVAYWLPTGLSVAVYLLNDIEAWPYLLAGQLLGNFAFDFGHGAGLLDTSIYCLTNLVQNLLGCFLIRKLVGKTPRMDVMRDFAAMVGCFTFANIFAVILQAALSWIETKSMEGFGNTIAVGVSSNTMLIVTLTPAILVWVSPSDQSQRWWTEPWRILEAYLALMVVCGIAYFVEQNSGDILSVGSVAFLIPVIWVGLRFGVRGAAALSFLLGLLVVYCAVRVEATHPQQIRIFGGYAAALYGFLTITALVGLIPAVSIAEKDILLQELAQTPTLWCDKLGTIRRINRSACDLLGFRESEVLGHRLADVGVSLPGQSWPERVEQMRKKSHLSYEFEYHPEGTNPKTLQANLSLFRHDGKEFVFLSLYNISELRLLEGRLLRTQKMEMLSEISGDVAKGFSEQINVIRANIEHLRISGQHANPELRERLGEIGQAVERSSIVTNQLLTLGRRTTLSRQLMDLNTVLSGFTTSLRREIDPAVQVELDLCDAPLPVMVDAAMLDKALFHLCLNAQDAMPDGGRLQLRSVPVTLAEKDLARIPGGRIGKYAKIYVVDNGTGISPESLKKIFEPFYTTKGNPERMGLGLAFTYSILQQHDGWIHVESQLGAGTVFTVYLPLLEAIA